MKRQPNTPLPASPLLRRRCDLIARRLELQAQVETMKRGLLYRYAREHGLCPLEADLMVRHIKGNG